MSVRILIGDVRERLRELPDESVHCVVTSPPYWGLRDYGTAEWEGGDAGCDHDQRRRERDPNSKSATNAGASRDGLAGKECCRKCGARRVDSQLGLESTPEEHVEAMVEVFREVRRVMRGDAGLWLNYGDSYASRTDGSHGGWNGDSYQDGTNPQRTMNVGTGTRLATGLKPKDLVGMPWRVAFALQADGWYLRSDIIWAKPNPMPESVTDRPTKSHEYVFLLTKNARYFYDADAVREDAAERSASRYRYAFSGTNGADAVNDRRTVPEGMREFDGGRNLRDVWTIPTAPFPGAHFATFPPKLVEPCIKAGTSEHGCCAECGAPWGRLTESSYRSSSYGRSERPDVPGSNDVKGNQDQFGTRGFSERKLKSTNTLGWSPTCACAAPVVPCRVLDPFGGAGTVGLVADRLGRDAVLIELNAEYAEMARRRIRDDCPLFQDVMIEESASNTTQRKEP